MADEHGPTRPRGLSVAEVARLTGRNEYVIRRWIRAGALPARQDAAWPYAYWIDTGDLARIARRRRWRRHAIPEGAVPDRLAAVAAIAGVGRARVRTG